MQIQEEVLGQREGLSGSEVGGVGGGGVPRMCPDSRQVWASWPFRFHLCIYTAFDLGNARSLVGGYHYLQTIEGTGRSLGS